MKFRNLSRTLLLFAAAAGITFGLTSCAADHTVGYVYVLGTTVNGQPGGQISALREYNNNGNLTGVSGSPLGSGGTNPIRAVVPAGNRFMYVLNAGTQSAPDSTGSVTYASANIQLFSIGGYGQLSQQVQYSSQGFGSTRIAVDSSGANLFVLDEYAPVGITAGSNTSPTASTIYDPVNYPCQDPNNPSIYHPTGDITVFSIDGSTGRLQVVQNARQQNINYFPVGCFPTDFRLAGTYMYTMDAGSASHNDLQTVFVQAVSGGQLTPTQTGAIKVGNGTVNPDITAITGDNGSKYVYLLDTLANKIYVYTIGTNGALTSVSGSPFNNNTQAVGPVQSVVDSTGKYFYSVNGGGTTGGTNNANADISGYVINQATGDLTTAISGQFTTLSTSGVISGPVCIFEDPTNQYLYSAGSLDNSITGRKLDPNTGILSPLNKAVAFPTVGTPSWCLGISAAL